MCLNNSVISGKCTGCAAYREQVDGLLAQLEDREEKLEAVEAHLMAQSSARFRNAEASYEAIDRILKGGV